MPTAPHTRRGHAHRATEFRVRFGAKLTAATLAPTADTPPPVRQKPAPVAPPAPAQLPPAPAAERPTDSSPSPLAGEGQGEGAAATAPDLTAEFLADRERIEGVLANLQTAVAEVRKDQNARLREWQKAAIELAMTIATRLLHDRVVSGELAMEEKVRDMVAQLQQDGPVAVHLNPDDLQLLEDRLGGEPLLPGRDDPKVIPDPTMARGECRVEGREGMLLSDVTRELHEIRDELMRSLGHARS